MLDDGSAHQRQVEICLAYTPTSAGAISVKREPRLIGKQFQFERFVGRASRQLRKLGKQIPILIKIRMIRLDSYNAPGYAIDTLIIDFIRTPPTFIRTCTDECGNPIP